MSIRVGIVGANANPIHHTTGDRFALDDANTGHLFILDKDGGELAVYAPEQWQYAAVVVSGGEGS